LLVAFYTAAMFSLFSDPWLESKSALWGFAGSVAAAILTKSVAGCCRSACWRSTGWPDPAASDPVSPAPAWRWR